VTPNFDLLLEGAYRLAGFRDRTLGPENPLPPTMFSDYVRITSPAEFFSEGKAHRTAVLIKMHGCARTYRDVKPNGSNEREWREALRDYLRSMVFTYREIQNWREDSWAADFLRTLLRTRTVVFAGYSLQDPVVHDTFRTVYEEMARIRRFAWYYPAMQDAGWTCWSVVVELALRRMVAALWKNRCSPAPPETGRTLGSLRASKAAENSSGQIEKLWAAACDVPTVLFQSPCQAGTKEVAPHAVQIQLGGFESGAATQNARTPSPLLHLALAGKRCSVASHGLAQAAEPTRPRNGRNRGCLRRTHFGPAHGRVHSPRSAGVFALALGRGDRKR